MMHALTWVDEVTPVITGDPGDPDIEFDPTLGRDALALLRKIADEPDEHSCMAEGCAFGRLSGKPAPVGYVLTEPDGPDQPGGLSWWWTTIVYLTGGQLLAVCEDCTPSTIYPQEAPR